MLLSGRAELILKNFFIRPNLMHREMLFQIKAGMQCNGVLPFRAADDYKDVQTNNNDFSKPCFSLAKFVKYCQKIYICKKA